MTDKSGLSRRRFLQALTVTGGLGLLSGAGTRALMTDEELLGDNRFRGGQIDANVVGEEVPGALANVGRSGSSWGSVQTTTDSGPSIQAAGMNSEPTAHVLSVGPLVSGQPTSLVLSLDVDTCDLVDIWLQVRTPRPVRHSVAAILGMKLAVARNAAFGTDSAEVLFDNNVDNVVDDLESGILLQRESETLLQRCTEKPVCEPLFLGFEWLMPSGRGASDSTTVKFVIDVVVQQCNQTGTNNPW